MYVFIRVVKLIQGSVQTHKKGGKVETVATVETKKIPLNGGVQFQKGSKKCYDCSQIFSLDIFIT